MDYNNILKNLGVENYKDFKFNDRGIFNLDSGEYISFWTFICYELNLPLEFIKENIKYFKIDYLLIFQPNFTYEIAKEIIGDDLITQSRYLELILKNKFIPKEDLIDIYYRKVFKSDIDSVIIIKNLLTYQKLPKEIIEVSEEEDIKNNIFLRYEDNFLGYVEDKTNIINGNKVISNNVRSCRFFIPMDLSDYYINPNNMCLYKSLINKNDIISPSFVSNYQPFRKIKVILPKIVKK